MRRTGLPSSFSILLVLCSAGEPVLSQQELSCADCHADEAAQYAASIHAHAQIDCRQCHGGELTYPVGDGVQVQQFDHGKAFRGKPTRFEIPETCATCHSDVARMNPYGLPANQLTRYRTSGHGKALFEKKSTTAAVCTDCHDVHAIFKSKDPRSRTHPLNVPDTCGRCHGDSTIMSEPGLSVEIMDEYRASVHGRGLLEAQDTGMPTCATCHGNHAATPPGVASVDSICGRCHQQADQFFLKSPHAQIDSFARCVACHGGENSHAIQRATNRPKQLVARWARSPAGSDDQAMIESLHPQLSLLTESCYECHDEDSDDPADVEAFKRSEELYRLIGEAEVTYARTMARIDDVGRGVLLVEDEQLMMADATTAVVELGPTQHMLQIDDIVAVTARLRESTDAVNASIEQKEADLAWRYWVLWPMWGFIVLFAVASYIKYLRLKAIHVKPLK